MHRTPYPGVSFSHRLSQRLDCSGRFSFRKPLLYGWHRNPQHQPLCHSGCIRRTGKYCQCRPDTRDYILYGRLPRQPPGALSSVLDFRLKDGNPDKQAFKATIGASEVSAQRSRPSGAAHHLSVLRTPVLPATFVQGFGTALPAQFH